MSDGLEPTMTTSEAALASLEAADNDGLPVETPVETNVVDAPVAEVPQDTGGINPAWNDLLTQVPSIYHSRLTEQLRAWDKAANDRITSVQSRYKPYEDFVANEIPPDMLRQSVELMQVFQNQPQALYEFLQQQLGPVPGQGQNDSGNEFDLGATDEDAPDPRIANLEQQQQQIIATFEAQRAEQEARQADIWLADQQAQLTQKHAGTELDWDFILTKAMLKGQQGMRDNNQALAAAAEEYVATVNKIRATPPAGASAPKVMPAAGGVQRSAVNIRQLGDQGRKDLALEILTALDQEG